MKHLSEPTAKDSGIALLMTLFVLVFLSVVAMNFAVSTRWGSASTRNFKEETTAYYAALRAYHDSVAYLLSDKNIPVDSLDESGNIVIDKETKPVTGKRTLDDAEIEIWITDAESRININAADQLALKKLFDHIGLPSTQGSEVVDSILDWRDADNEHRLNGAENSYYESLSPSYQSKNSNLSTTEELLLIKDFSRDYLYGGNEIGPLNNLITTMGDGSININTASKEVMEIMGVAPSDIDIIMKQRALDAGGVTVMPASAAVLRIFRTASNNFKIEIISNMKGSSLAVKITSFVRRVATPNGLNIQTVYWRESVEGRRA